MNTADVSHREPDGVTLQVRFCEGGVRLSATSAYAATLQTRIAIFSNTHGADCPDASLPVSRPGTAPRAGPVPRPAQIPPLADEAQQPMRPRD
jgi:hypothetical protein